MLRALVFALKSRRNYVQKVIEKVPDVKKFKNATFYFYGLCAAAPALPLNLLAKR